VFAVRGSWVYVFSTRLSLSMDAAYAQNNSTVPDTFSYQQPSLSLGVNYTF
jgi:hypothetical protein